MFGAMRFTIRNNGFRLMTRLKVTSSNGLSQHSCFDCFHAVSMAISCHSTFSEKVTNYIHGDHSHFSGAVEKLLA